MHRPYQREDLAERECDQGRERGRDCNHQRQDRHQRRGEGECERERTECGGDRPHGSFDHYLNRQRDRRAGRRRERGEQGHSERDRRGEGVGERACNARHYLVGGRRDDNRHGPQDAGIEELQERGDKEHAEIHYSLQHLVHEVCGADKVQDVLRRRGRDDGGTRYERLRHERRDRYERVVQRLPEGREAGCSLVGCEQRNEYGTAILRLPSTHLTGREQLECGKCEEHEYDVLQLLRIAEP